MKKILLSSIICLTCMSYADNIDKEDDKDLIVSFYNCRDKDGNIDKTEG